MQGCGFATSRGHSRGAPASRLMASPHSRTPCLSAKACMLKSRFLHKQVRRLWSISSRTTYPQQEVSLSQNKRTRLAVYFLNHLDYLDHLPMPYYNSICMVQLESTSPNSRADPDLLSLQFNAHQPTPALFSYSSHHGPFCLRAFSTAARASFRVSRM